jgi:hypothetical protein
MMQTASALKRFVRGRAARCVKVAIPARCWLRHDTLMLLRIMNPLVHPSRITCTHPAVPRRKVFQRINRRVMLRAGVCVRAVRTDG